MNYLHLNMSLYTSNQKKFLQSPLAQQRLKIIMIKKEKGNNRIRIEKKNKNNYLNQ